MFPKKLFKNLILISSTSFNSANIIIQECSGSDFGSAVCKDMQASEISAITPKTDFTGVSISLKNSMKENTIYKVILKSSKNNPTNNPTDGIANSCGKPLDGNKNLKVDGTPADDYSIIFKTGKTDDCEPIISSVVPSSGYYNDKFKVAGDNFGIFGEVSISGMQANDNCTNANPITATNVNDEESCYNSWNNKEINVKVPFASVTGQLKVELTDAVKAVYKDDFNVLSPYLSKLQPDKGPAGEFIRISGKNFGNDTGKAYFISANSATLGAVTEVFAPSACSNVDTWKDNEIIIETPVLAKGYYAVVILADGHFSNYLVYQITDGVPGPGLCGVVPDQATKGTSVKLEGIRFGDSSDTRDPNASVDFTGVKMAKNGNDGIESWKDQTIKLNVPNGAVDGYVKVTANSKESNPVYFNVLKSDLESDYPVIVESPGCDIDSRSPSPSNNAETACTNIIPEVRFNMDMNINTFSGNFEIKKCSGHGIDCNTNVSGTVTNIGLRRIAFKPTANFIANTWYQVTIKTGVKSLGTGKNLKNSYTWSFKTRAEGECQIDILNVFPSEDTINLGETSSLSANPSSSLDKCATLYSPDAFYNWSSENLSTVVVQSISVNKILNIGNAVALGKGETVGTRVNAKYKNTAITDYSNIIVKDSGFPIVVDSAGCETDHRSPSPYAGFTNACTNEIVKARFNIPMNISSFNGNIEVSRCRDNGVSCDTKETGTISSIGNTVIAFRPTKNFTANTWYQVTIKTGVKSLGTGKNLKNSFSWSFKTRAEGECQIDVLNVFPTAQVMDINTIADLTSNPSSSLDRCATLYSPGAFYNWSSKDLSKVTIKSSSVDSNLGTGLATIFGKAETPLTLVEAQYKNTDIKDTSDITVIDSGFPVIINSPGCETDSRSPSPTNSSEGACTNMLPEVRFNIDMNISSFAGNFEIKKCSDNGINCDTAVGGTVTNIGLRRIIFKPSLSLDSNVWYQATIKTGVKSLALGKNMKNAYTWTFKTRAEGDCKVDMINVNPTSMDINVNSNGNLNATASSSVDVCAFIYDATAEYNWSSKNINTVTIKSTSLDQITKAGLATIFGKSATPLNNPTKVEAQYKKTNIKDTSDITVNAHGIGSPCANSLECASGLCCSSVNLCTNAYSTCVPRVPEIASCSAENNIDYANYVLTNPSPFRNKTNVCRNAIINVMFDTDMVVDGSLNAINNVNNIKISECTGSFDSPICANNYSPSKINTIGSRTITFVPNNGLESKFYRIVVAGNVQMNFQNVHNALGSDYSWMFTVGEDCKIDRIDGYPGVLSLQSPYDANDQLDSVLGSSQGKCLSLQAPAGSVFNWHTADSSKVGLCTDNTYSSCNGSDISSKLVNIKGKTATNNIENLVDVSVILPNNSGTYYSKNNIPQTSLVSVETCSDGFQNWNETDIDKGGVCGGGAASCGNSITELGEECDNGTNNGKDGKCTSACKSVGGLGYTCTNSNDCNTTLCCSSGNKCTNIFSECPPRIPETSSCLAENSALSNILSNPSPFKGKTNACPNVDVVVSFDLDVITDETNIGALNNLNNIKFENCGSTGTPCMPITLTKSKISITNKRTLKISIGGLVKNNFYKATLYKNIKSLYGVNMLNDYSWTFKTREEDCKIDGVYADPGSLLLHDKYSPNYQLVSSPFSNDGKCMRVSAPNGSTYVWNTADVSKVGLCTNDTYSSCNTSTTDESFIDLINIKGKSLVKNNLVDVALTVGGTGEKYFSKNNSIKTSLVSVETCSDGIKNGNETDIDKGGACDPHCGNGICESVAYGENSVNCSKDCASFCNNDNVLDFGEICSGTNLSGKTCSDFGYNSGTLMCSSGCNYYINGCFTCGNKIKEDAEQCDDGVDNGKTGSTCTATCTNGTGGGVGDPCNDAYLGCNVGLCCSAEKKCIEESTGKCVPVIVEQPSCHAKDPSNADLFNVQISNPSPYKNEISACTNSRVIVSFNIDMKTDGSLDAINNINNFEIIKCNDSTCSSGSSVKSLGSISSLTTARDMVWQVNQKANDPKYLEFNTYYKVTINKRVKTKWGIASPIEYSWIFKTRSSDCKIDIVEATPGNVILKTLSDPYKELRDNPMSSEGKCMSIIPPIGTIYDWKTANVNIVGICSNINDTNCSLSNSKNEVIKVRGLTDSNGQNILVDVALTLPAPDNRTIGSYPNTSKIRVVESICGDGIKEGREECDNGSKNGALDNACSNGLDGYIACRIKPKINGVCGSAASASVFKPTDNLCSSGTPSTVYSSDANDSGPWGWRCVGLSGGTTVTCSAFVNNCGNGKIDAGEMCDVGNIAKNLPVKFDTITNICDTIFGDDNYTQISGDPVCNAGCVVDVSKACVSTYKFDQACTSGSSKVVTLNNSFGSGDLNLFSKINGTSEWKIDSGALYYPTSDSSTIIYSVKVDADNYSVKGSFKATSGSIGLVLNKSKDGLNYYKIEFRNNNVYLYKGKSLLVTKSFAYSVDKWYNFTITYRSDVSNSGSNIKFDISKDGKNSSDAAVNANGFVNIFNYADGSRIARGYFGVSTESNNGIYFDNLYLEYNDDLYEYNNASYNFGFYYCKSGGSGLSIKNDNINTNDAVCSDGKYKCIDRSCRTSCSINECKSEGSVDCMSSSAKNGDCCGVGEQCSSGKCITSFTNYGGFSGVYVIPSATNDTAKAFVDSNGRPVMVMRIWSVPRMYSSPTTKREGEYGPFINFIEWLKRMNIGGSYNFIKRSTFPYDYMIYNQGNSYYFWAPNITSDGKGYINVYVLTYQEGGDKSLFDEIINNVRFTTNLE
ncbi:MAG: Ig-like domain-containing protein [Patescibacteria group bacterium]